MYFPGIVSISYITNLFAICSTLSNQKRYLIPYPFLKIGPTVWQHKQHKKKFPDENLSDLVLLAQYVWLVKFKNKHFYLLQGPQVFFLLQMVQVGIHQAIFCEVHLVMKCNIHQNCIYNLKAFSYMTKVRIKS